MNTRKRLVVLCLAMATALAGIGRSASGAEVKPKVTLTIFAASSLSGSFTEIATRFQRENPTILLRFSFLASSVLASQLVCR